MPGESNPIASTAASGQKMPTFNVGALAPGQSKEIPVSLKAEASGKHCNDASVATSDAGFGLFQNPDNLFFAEPFASHLRPPGCFSHTRGLSFKLVQFLGRRSNLFDHPKHFG